MNPRLPHFWQKDEDCGCGCGLLDEKGNCKCKRGTECDCQETDASEEE